MGKRYQITCLCSAYNFPHRINSGECNGGEWCEAYTTHYGEYCTHCSLYTNNSCEVVLGGEDVTECEAYRFYLHSNSPIKLPSLSDDPEDIYQNYYRSLEER